jgi:hypothetical protein
VRLREKQSPTATRSRRLVIVIASLFVSHILAFGQGLTSENLSNSQHPSLLPTPLESQALEDSYRPIKPAERFRWFVTSAIGPAHFAGVAFVSAGGTAVDRPGEYGPHYRGLADRFGMGMVGGAAGNAIEMGVGLGLREDPRYFRVPQQAFRARIGNVARLTFMTRNGSGTSKPAYARYVGIVGGNFLSNTWRVHSEASPRDALLRSSEGFAGRMAANAFKEFWPDVKRHVLRKEAGRRIHGLEYRHGSLGDHALTISEDREFMK